MVPNIDRFVELNTKAALAEGFEPRICSIGLLQTLHYPKLVSPGLKCEAGIEFLLVHPPGPPPLSMMFFLPGRQFNADQTQIFLIQFFDVLPKYVHKQMLFY